MARKKNLVPSEQQKKLQRGIMLLNRLELLSKKSKLSDSDKVRIQAIAVILKYVLPTYKQIEMKADVTADVQVTHITEELIG